MNQAKILHAESRLRIAVTVRSVGTLLSRWDAPAEAVEHGVQDVDQAEIRKRLVCLTLAPGSQESAQDE